MTFYFFDLSHHYWSDFAWEDVNTNTNKHNMQTSSSVRRSLRSQVKALAAVSTSVLCLIGPFAVQSHLSRKPPLPLMLVPFAQAAGLPYTHSPLAASGLEHVSGIRGGQDLLIRI